MKNSNHSQKPSQERGKVSTLDILGGRNGIKVRAKWAEHHKRLTELRERLIGDKKNHTESAQEELSNFSEHMADAATDSYDRDCALALLSSAQEAIYEIELALNRIASGTYGICELSGEPIETERLKAIPWTRFSKIAQVQLETRGVTSRVQLGELGTCLNSPGSEEAGDDEGDEMVPARAEREVA